MARFAKYQLTPTATTEWLGEYVSKLQTHTGQAFDYFGTRRSDHHHHTSEMRDRINDIRELCDILEAKLDAADAPQVEEAA